MKLYYELEMMCPDFLYGFHKIDSTAGYIRTGKHRYRTVSEKFIKNDVTMASVQPS